MRTVCFVLKELGQEKLTSKYYQQLHDICVDGTVIVKYGEVKISVDKGYRDIGIIKYNKDYFVKPCSYGLPSEWYSEEGFKELCQNYKYRDGGDSRYKDQGHPVGRALRDDPDMIKKTLSFNAFTETKALFFNAFTEKECEAHADCIFDQYYKDIDQVRQEIMDKHGQQEWTWDFVKDLPRKTERKS